MCGISVLINKNHKSVNPQIIYDMNNSIIHRGPDDEGFYFYNHVALGHRRLSIIDLTNAGHQPMLREHLCISYNGEIYNYVELKDELIDLGHSFKSATDTEVILAAYEEWGVDAFNKFNGMWAFAIHDKKKNEIIFSRDHFGIKPLYYASIQDYFAAGSEIKQFKFVPGFIPRLNKSIAINYLLNGLLNYSEDTFFEEVKELRAGHYIQFNLLTNQFIIKKWYDLSNAKKDAVIDYNISVKKTFNLFKKSIKIRMRSDVTIGSLLSGGIDSSAIVTMLKNENLAINKFKTFTTTYEDKKLSEEEFSNVIIDETGYLNFKTRPDMNHIWEMNIIDKIIYHQDQPLLSASCISEYSAFSIAKEHNIKVMLDGQGADEYFCGYSEFYIAYIKELIKQRRFKRLFDLIKYKSVLNNVSLQKQISIFLKTAYYFRIIRFIKKTLRKPIHKSLSNKWNNIARKTLIYYNYNNIYDLSILELLNSSLPYQLHSEDRNSMMFSIESRLPFLDHELVEYVLGLSSDYKIEKGYTKYILRDAMTQLPFKVRYRKDKMGFEAPEESWILKNESFVRSELKKLLLDSDIFSERIIIRFELFIKGKIPYDPIFFRAITFGRFCKIFNIQIA